MFLSDEVLSATPPVKYCVPISRSSSPSNVLILTLGFLATVPSSPGSAGTASSVLKSSGVVKILLYSSKYAFLYLAALAVSFISS